MADEQVRAELHLRDGLRTTLSTRLHTWTGDGHQSDDLPAPEGPDPFAQLLGSLGSCMAMTVALYARRKDWALDAVKLSIEDERKPAGALERARVRLELEGDLDDEQRARLLDISGRCPVHRTLSAGVEIETALA